MVTDVFSKYGWIVPLKDEKGEIVVEAFKTIFKEGRNHNIYELIRARLISRSRFR